METNDYIYKNICGLGKLTLLLALTKINRDFIMVEMYNHVFFGGRLPFVFHRFTTLF